MRLTIRRLIPAALLAVSLTGLAIQSADAAEKQSCARPAAGSVIAAPPDLYSNGGSLSVSFNYVTNPDAEGRTLYCYVTPDGLESPTLHVKPGDTLNITLTNKVRPPKGQDPAMDAKMNARMNTMNADMEVSKRCGAGQMNAESVNLHFHGANVTPACHGDEVIHTLVNSGQTFAYSVQFPKDEPPGLYWYHPHVHGMSSLAVEGGASGAIVVDGIEQLQPKVARLPARLLVMRDQNVEVPGNAKSQPGGSRAAKQPSWDVSLNYVPVSFPALTPSVIEMVPGQKEFWRVLNASADTIADLQLKYDGVVQTVELVGLDGVPLGSQDGTRHGHTASLTDVYIPPAGRAEFIVTAPPAGTKHATLTTAKIDTGPAGDVDTKRELAVIRTDNEAGAALPVLPDAMENGNPLQATRQRFEGLDQAPVTATRRLYFSEIFPDPKDPDEGLFYITVNGAVPELFDPKAPPAITTVQGAVEDWVIENRTQEVHEFHIHQIHFQVRKINGVAVDASQRQFRDTFQVPYWSGTGPYPSVTLRMDFRGDVIGDFVYHCHILDHEDLGMMAIVRVVAANKSH